MASRYINPGYGAWFNDSAVSTVENNFTYNPIHGISFAKQASSDTDENEIPLTQAFTTDISAKFNLYIGNTFPANFYFGAKAIAESVYNPKIKYHCIGICTENTGSIIYLLAGNQYSTTGGQLGSTLLTSAVFKKNSLNTILFHIHRGEDAESSYGEITINNTTQTAQFTTNNYKYPFSDAKAFYIQFPTNTTAYMSELIVSADKISPREKIIALPISSIETDMTASDNGIYIADAADQFLLQTPNVAALSEEFGADSAVTGISLIGNPAYKTGSGLTTLTSLSKANSVITEHGICALSDDSAAVIQNGWTLNNTTLADLQGMQFGWKAGE